MQREADTNLSKPFTQSFTTYFPQGLYTGLVETVHKSCKQLENYRTNITPWRGATGGLLSPSPVHTHPFPPPPFQQTARREYLPAPSWGYNMLDSKRLPNRTSWAAHTHREATREQFPTKS